MQTTEQLWERLQAIIKKQQLSHALLFVSLDLRALIDLCYALASLLLCNGQERPCEKCKSCRLVKNRQHPDLFYIEPVKTTNSHIIKIDQIRDLQHVIFRSPQLGKRRIIILRSAEKMNIASANALLKVLEEPPAEVYFFLIAEQISTIPPTIISRCQQWRLMPRSLDSDYLSFLENSSLNLLEKQRPDIINELSNFLSHKISVFNLAQKWSTHEFLPLIGLLYVLNSQLIDYRLRKEVPQEAWAKSLYESAQRFHLVHLFKQLDRINEITRKLQQNINLNKQLVLENLLLGYT